MGAANGNSSDRDSFCQQYGPIIRAYLAARWRIPFSSDAVTEATQEVFLQFFQDNSAFDRIDRSHQSGFRGFLYGVTNRTAAVLERKDARQRRDSSIPEFDPDRIERSEANLSVVFDRAWAKMLGREARKLMMERARRSEATANRMRCLELRFVRGTPPRDIAPLLGVKVERVYEMLGVARKEFRAALLDVMSSYHPELSEKELEAKCAELTMLA